MELNDFVAQSLVEIMQGVQDARKQCTDLDLNCAINPVWGGLEKYDPSFVREVTFDIAVTVSDKTAGKGGAGINVYAAKLGGEVAKSAESSHVSRIQFSIPIIPPATKVVPGEEPLNATDATS